MGIVKYNIFNKTSDYYENEYSLLLNVYMHDRSSLTKFITGLFTLISAYQPVFEASAVLTSSFLHVYQFHLL